MSILPSAILALRSGTATPPVRAIGGAGAPSGPARAASTKKMPLPDTVEHIAPSKPVKTGKPTKRDLELAERAATSARIRDLVDTKPTKAAIMKYMKDRIGELNLMMD